MYVAAHGWIEPPPGGIVDPLEVFDAVGGFVLHEGVEQFATPESAGDLRANVWGGIVDTYEWDVSGAPAAINVTGEDTPRLQFDWDDANTGMQTIVITTVNDGHDGADAHFGL